MRVSKINSWNFDACGVQPTPQDNQLMSKHRVLSFKPQLRLEWRGQDGQNETEQPDHSANLGDSITASTRMRFSVHTRLIDWSPFLIMGNTMPPRDPEEDEEDEEDEEEDDNADEQPVVGGPDED